MRIFLSILCLLFISCEAFWEDSWTQCFANNSNKDTYFYLDYYKDGKVSYPAYDGLKEQPTLILAKSHNRVCISMSPTNFKDGVLGHMYAFSPDTLDRYSWEEVLAKKKYWFTARPCQLEPIPFPEEFEYMGDM